MFRIFGLFDLIHLRSLVLNGHNLLFQRHYQKYLVYYSDCFDRQNFRSISQIATTESTLNAPYDYQNDYRDIIPVHHQVTLSQTGFQGNNSIKQLVKHGRVMEARQLLLELNICDVYSWTAILSGYVNIGKADEALDFFCHMQNENIAPNNVTFISALKACVMCISLDWGRQIHALIVHTELEFDVYVGSCLVDMYAKCGSIHDSAKVFSQLSVHNVVSWSILISGYVKEGLGAAALDCFSQMQQEKIAPNEVTFASNLSACALVASLEKGQQLHRYAVCCGFEVDQVVESKLIDMYMKCGYIEGARHVFEGSGKHELVSWNTMIDGYAHHCRGREAIQLFHQMIAKGMRPEKSTFLSCLKACAHLQDLEKGEHIYACIRNGRVEIDSVLGSTLIDMFAKCGSIENAYRVFKLLRDRDVIAWTIMISALFQHGDDAEAFKLFEEMRQQARVLPDRFTYNCMINACARTSDFDGGKRLHADIIANKLELDVAIGSSLVDMYANCGDLDKALEVFNRLSEKDVVAWNAMIACTAQHGDCKALHSHLKIMHKSGIVLDKITYMSILSACNHWGLVDEGYQLMGFIATDPCSRMIAEHCSCLIDLLGRAGHLIAAEDFIKKMPFQPGSTDWMSVLGACKLLYKADIAKVALEKLQELDPHCATAYVLYANTLEGVDD